MRAAEHPGAVDDTQPGRLVLMHHPDVEAVLRPLLIVSNRAV